MIQILPSRLHSSETCPPQWQLNKPLRRGDSPLSQTTNKSQLLRRVQAFLDVSSFNEFPEEDHPTLHVKCSGTRWPSTYITLVL